MIDTIRDINESILKINNQITKLQSDKQNLIYSKEVLLRTNNICPDCFGEGYHYRKSDGSDPYERSSDLRENCSRCDGTGRYIAQRDE